MKAPRWLLVLALALPTAPARAQPAPQRAPAFVRSDTTPPERPRVAPPEVALAQQWMSLDVTGVDVLRKAQPLADGRGVLIAILDTGIDADIPGLGRTSDGAPKLLDLRDFSAEGRIALVPVVPKGDTIVVAGAVLRGMSRVAARAPGPWYAGVLREIQLGSPPAADVNGNGSGRDVLPVVVGRASDGWVLFTDTNGDGTLADERPVHDYLVAHETFGWRHGAGPSPLTVAVNFSEMDDAPVLDLLFDTSGHGSHVAGIAAGHDIYGVAGFDGVAPGAQVLGLKIGNDAIGGLSTTEAMRDAMDYAIRFASARRMPLVMNMSFGVGNEREGAARIDAIVDSVLAAHPDVVFAISAGNDGPALSTLGFPGSSSRALTIGALLPGRFVPPGPGGAAAPDAVAYFSSRGGEMAKPDIVTPGVAYSTVPRWDRGGEIEGGTSMASPHAAGLAALLLSAALQARQHIDATSIRQALMVTAARLPDAGYLAQGAGVPDVSRAWQWLLLDRSVPPVAVQAATGTTAALSVTAPGQAVPSQLSFSLHGAAGRTDTFALRSSAAWLQAPASVALTDSASVALSVDTLAVSSTPVTGVVTGWLTDTLAGPAFRLVTTLTRAAPPAFRMVDTLTAASSRGLYFVVDSARPVNVRVSSSGAGVQAFLHEPGGMPYRDGSSLVAGAGDDAALFSVDASDARPGLWQLAAATSSVAAMVQADIAPSPATLTLNRVGDSVEATLTNLEGQPVTGSVLMGILGTEQRLVEHGKGPAMMERALEVPTWARFLVVDLSMSVAQWEKLTDFGVTLLDSTGAQLEQSPMNYAEGRLHHAFAGSPGRVTLAYYPGFADSADAASWSLEVRLRYYAEDPVRLSASGAKPVLLAPYGTVRVREAWVSPGWTLPPEAQPLGVVTLEVGNDSWTSEASLSAPSRGAAIR